MIGLIDPAHFVRQLDSRAKELAFAKEIRLLLKLCTEQQIALMSVADYWDPLFSELIAPLDRCLHTQEARSCLTELRKKGIRPRALPEPERGTRVWGFRAMFGESSKLLTPKWEDRMTRAAVRLVALKQPIVLLARLIPGRNMIRHAVGNLVLDEITQWRLYVQPRSPEPIAIPCIRLARQLSRPETARLDPRLPFPADGARYPFCTPARWWKRATAVVRTVASKPAFVDAADRAWTRPNIAGGKGYHWDVFIDETALIQRIGVEQLNIVEFGAPATEGRPGEIHHQPGEKQGRIQDIGWTCP